MIYWGTIFWGAFCKLGSAQPAHMDRTRLLDMLSSRRVRLFLFVWRCCPSVSRMDHQSNQRRFMSSKGTYLFRLFNVVVGSVLPLCFLICHCVFCFVVVFSDLPLWFDFRATVHSTSGEIQAEGNDLADMAAEWVAQEGSTSPYYSVAPVYSMYMFSDNYSFTGTTSWDRILA